MSEGNKRGRAALIQKFQTLTKERLERLNTAFLALESNPGDSEAESVLLREIHTLKGEAKLMGFADINMVAHRTEDLLLNAKKRDFRIPPTYFDFVLRAFDLMGQLLTKGAGDAGAAPVDLPAFSTAVEQLLAGGEADPAKSPKPPAPDSGGQAAAEATSSPASTTTAFQGSTDTTFRIEASDLEELTRYVGDLLQYQAQAERASSELQRTLGLWKQELSRQPHLPRAGGNPAEESANTGTVEQGTKGSLDYPKLHQLGLEGSRLTSRLSETLVQAGDTLEQLELTVRDLRLVPLHELFMRYPRAIRDLAREQGKKVSVAVDGGHLRVDNYVLNRLGEPLLHLVRNSVDHGVESPEQRRRSGKPEEARITLKAEPSGAHVEVSVSDDGRGLSADLIRRAAISRGLLTPEEAEALTEEERLQLIFRAGFSTRSRATDISGRGIGLDVVKATVEGLGGAVRVSSTPGKGTQFSLSVPISAALTRVLVVTSGVGSVVLPTARVLEIMLRSDLKLLQAGRGHAFRRAGQLVPLADLDTLLGAPRPEADARRADLRVIVVHGDQRLVGLQVTGIVGEREVLQRPLDNFLGETRLFIGSATLEGRQPAFVLNVSELVRRAGVTEMATARRDQAEPSVQGGMRVLVVDDSELMRPMLASVIRGEGHRVTEANNGKAALLEVDKQLPDLLVTDLEMPVMDGFELIQAVRARPELGDLPILVVSGLGSAEDRQRASDLGADGYVVKSEFSEEVLRRAVARLLGPR